VQQLGGVVALDADYLDFDPGAGPEGSTRTDGGGHDVLVMCVRVMCVLAICWQVVCLLVACMLTPWVGW